MSSPYPINETRARLSRNFARISVKYRAARLASLIISVPFMSATSQEKGTSDRKRTLASCRKRLSPTRDIFGSRRYMAIHEVRIKSTCLDSRRDEFLQGGKNERKRKKKREAAATYYEDCRLYLWSVSLAVSSVKLGCIAAEGETHVRKQESKKGRKHARVYGDEVGGCIGSLYE